MTKLILYYREYGMYYKVKEMRLPKSIEHYYDFESNKLKENQIVKDIPEGWLPTSPKNILMNVKNSENGSESCVDLEIFRNFAKYFNSYAITLYLSSDSNNS